ncbi:type II secretion system F family protein [Arthrobacter oryzae]|jgi:pilus assembly protein TadC|uniref:type II secretion system F family protein n=1 Tax=Arthrobacter oryzae TaxID=409290 RepID=UPI002780A9EF|nr:type II secretion system F family protein [Arthrobacter oryzae]MDQ0078291.1 pilus assembly protein TadC [Arthrobacter oryzae]
MTGEWLSSVFFALALAAAATLALTGRGGAHRRLLRQHQVHAGEGKNGDGGTTDGPNLRADEGLRDTAMMLELIGAMLDAGSGIGRALELVADSASPEYHRSLRPVVSALAIGADWDTAWRSSEARTPELLILRQALGFAALTGAPSSAILYAQAARLRRERFRAAEKRAAALGVRLVVPLGLCSLPAFVCLGVVPVLLAMLPSGA